MWSRVTEPFRLAAVGIVTALAVYAAMSVYDVLVDDPAVKAATLAVARENFNQAVEGLSDEADKAIARAVSCRADGRVWLSGRGECIDKRD